MTDGPGPHPRHNLWPLQAPGQPCSERPEEKERGWFTFGLRLEWNRRVSLAKGLLPTRPPPPGLAATEVGTGQTQEIINPNQALPSQEARLALVTERSCPQERPVLPGGGLRPPPLSPPPPHLFPVTTCKPKTNLPLPPHALASARPPPRPTPPPKRAPAAGGPAECNSPRPALRPGPVRTD